MRRLAIVLLLCLGAQVYAVRMMVIQTANGARDVFYLSEAQKITFDDVIGTKDPAKVSQTVFVTSFSVMGTCVRYAVARPSDVRIDIVTPSGRVVGGFHEPWCNSGSYSWNLSGKSRLASGIYVVHATIGEKTFVIPLALTTGR